ncbi:MAG: DUF3891 family protein [Acidobacteriota bacterium]
MFLYREDAVTGAWAIPQASHSWLAWQLASHWGNRRFVRPSPRAEVMAAVLMHDGGWTEYDAAPGIDPEGRPVTFDRMAVGEHLDIWRSCVARTAIHSRYAALLVAAHFADLAGRKASELLGSGDTGGARSTQAFRAEMERLQDGWVEELKADARYETVREGQGRRVNAAVLAACDLVSVMLCASMPFQYPVRAVTSRGKVEELTMTALSDRVFKMSPWPFEGTRIKVHCEGRHLRSVRFPSVEAFHEDLTRARVERLAFEFVRPGSV